MSEAKKSTSGTSSLMDRIRAEINYWDILVVALFLAASAVYTYLRWQGLTPFIFLNSDAANISCFVAGREHPDMFTRDALLGNPINFHYYSTVQIPLLRGLVHIFGDYGTSFLMLLPPHIFVQLLGFYVLGRLVFSDRFWAVLLVLINLRHLPTGIGADFWGLYGDAIPRITIQACFPWILAAAWHWRKQPRAWPWILVAAGLLMYAHPVSAPAFGFALWLGFWFFMPAEWSFWKRIAHMLYLGIVFLLATFPFTRNYITNHSYGASFDYDTIFEIMHFRFNTIFMDVPYAISHSMLRLIESLLLPMTILCGIILWRYNGRSRQGLVLVSAWIAGFLFVSMPLPLAEHTICRYLKIIPLEIDLIRNVRFIYPLGLMICLWAMKTVWSTHADIKVRHLALAAALVGLLGWSLVNRPPWMDKPSQSIFKSFSVEPVHPSPQSMLEAMDFVKNQTPVGSTFVPASHVNPLAIRYYALRPVLICSKDGGSLAFTNHEKLVEWYDDYLVMKEVDEARDPEKRLKGFISMAQDMDADYVFLDFGKQLVMDTDTDIASHIVFGNDYYTIIEIQ